MEPGMTHDDVKLFGAIVTQMSSDAAFSANALDDARLRHIKQLEDRLMIFNKRMEDVFARTDSATARDALDEFQWEIDQIKRDRREH